MSRTTTRADRRHLKRENSAQPDVLTPVPREQWPLSYQHMTRAPTQVWRSRDFLVQVYENEHPLVAARLSINTTSASALIDRFDDGITWDELQRIKGECGYGFSQAVEIYPDARHVVNVANMRHLWVLRDPLPFAWSY